MIKPERKPLVTLMAVLLATLVLTACGGGADSAPTSTPVPPAATATPVPPTAESVPPTDTPMPPTATPAPEPLTEAPESPAAGDAENGQQVAQTAGCAGCHSVDGTKVVGPSWKGIFGKTETLADGSTAVVDEAYIQESILTPSAKVVADFPDGVMPKTFGDQLSEEQIADLIAYIQSLK